MIVLDTNVLSAVVRSEPSPAKEWFAQQDPDDLWTTAINAAEMLFGVYLLDEGERRDSLQMAVSGLLFEDYAGRVLPFDGLAADEYARLVARLRRAGTPTGTLDAQIVAIALAHGASIATRNVGHFENCGVDLVDPWSA